MFNVRTMALEYAVFGVLLITGTVNAQSVLEPPSKATGLVGDETVTFTCRVAFTDRDRLMFWAFGVTSNYLYSFNGDSGTLLGDPNKYSVEFDGSDTFILTVMNLETSDGGAYHCQVLTDVQAAQLIVLEEPIVFTNTPTETEGSIVQYTCEGRFGANSDRNAFDPNHFPTIRMLFDGNLLTGLVEERDPDGSILYYTIIMEVNITLQSNHDQLPLICELKTPNPDVRNTGQLLVEVLYHPNNIQFYPNEEQYSVGQVINCTAGGNPSPTIQWRNEQTGELQPSGQYLTITEDMVGANSWTCSATNTINGVSEGTSAPQDFDVVESEQPPGESTGPESWKIAVGVAVPICIIIIGAIVGLVVYTFVLKKKKPQQQGGGSAPVSGIPMNNNPSANPAYKHSIEDDAYYPDEKVPAFTIHSPNKYQNAPNLPFSNGQGTPPPNYAYQTNLLGTGLGSNMSLPLDDRTPDQTLTKPRPAQRTKSQEELDRQRSTHVSFDRSARDDYNDKDGSDDDDDSDPPTPPPPMHNDHTADFFRAPLPGPPPPPDTMV